MTSISQWGPIVWKLLHTIIESINEKHFQSIYKELFIYIKSICTFLPCPRCSNHARDYLSRIKYEHINTKEKFRLTLFNFHNNVNKMNKKELFKIEDIDVYKEYSLVECYNNFVKIFGKKGNLQQITQSFQRKLILQKFMNWLQINKRCFTSK